jgi:hypothetical protein
MLVIRRGKINIESHLLADGFSYFEITSLNQVALKESPI